MDFSQSSLPSVENMEALVESKFSLNQLRALSLLLFCIYTLDKIGVHHGLQQGLYDKNKQIKIPQYSPSPHSEWNFNN